MTKIILNNPESVRDPKALAAAAKAVKMIGGGRDRRRALMDQGIFITTSGMLTGGPVMSYLKHFYKDPDTSILLTGYQGEHTNGDLLIKKKQVYIDGWRTGVDCYVEQFDFSAHAGLSELKRIAKDASPETIIVNHGDPKAVESLAEWARALDFKVETPELGDMIKL
ncbi:MAG: hypothetical protein KJ574_00085 [Nanoarchaeota archaeon]|nr:hypothetical protein [Nanoarchaeota archaeon]